MRIASHTLGFNINKFLPDVIDNAGPYVDKIYVALPSRPWGYNPAMRQTENPTKLEHFRNARYFDKIEFIEGDWDTDEGMRNACLEKAKQDGFDWLITQDADEFYTESSWHQIIKFLHNAPMNILATSTTWFNFWKSAQYILQYDNGSIKDKNTGFALRCSPELKFDRSRKPNVKDMIVLDIPCYHFGYVLSDEEMQLKIKTWMHTTEFNPERWYLLKWHRWTERSRFLNPTNPTFWDRAIRTPFELPDFAQKYAVSLDSQRVPPFAEKWSDVIYDASYNLKDKARYFKRVIRGKGELLR